MKSVELALPFFSYPKGHQIRIGILSSIFLFLFNIAWMLSGFYGSRGWYFLIMVFILVIHAIVIVKTASNILFIFRYVHLWSLTIGSSIAWSFHDNILVAPFGEKYQTYEATMMLVGSGVFAISATCIAWYSSFFRGLNNRISTIITIRKFDAKWLSLISLAVVYLAIAVFIYREGGFVGAGKTYAQGRNDLGADFGILNIIVFYFTAVYFLTKRTYGDYTLKSAIVMLLPYVLAILSGNRADYLMQSAILAFGSFVILRNKNKFHINFFKLGLAGFSLFLTSMFIGVWRDIGSFDEALNKFMNSSIFIEERMGISVLALSTGNQMLSGFYAVYSKLNLLNENYLYGISYLDFILRTPPAFLGIDRPEDLASQMEVAGELMQQGGIYELTEAFWNFGLVGVFLVPYVITKLFASVLKQSITTKINQIFWMASFLTIGLLAPRAIWYQTFAYWRAFTFLVVIFSIVIIIKSCSRQFKI